MKYLWQVYDETKRYNVPKQLAEPYSEVQEDNGNCIVVSPLFRFEPVFSALLKAWQDEIIDEKVVKEIENILYHYLAYLDYMAGMRFCLLMERGIEQEILQGHWGINVRKMYLLLTETEKKQLLNLLRKKRIMRNKKSFFCEAVTNFLGYTQLYYYGYERKFLLYIPHIKTSEMENKLNLIRDLFFDVTAGIEIFWDQHIGFIGQEQTMKIDQVIIY